MSDCRDGQAAEELIAGTIFEHAAVPARRTKGATPRPYAGGSVRGPISPCEVSSNAPAPYLTRAGKEWVREVALIIWKDAMSVGVDVLDADHIIVASLINHIDDAKQSGTDERAIGRILRVLIDHAFRHFAREERLLEAHAYPLLEEHKREHRLVEEQLQELHDAYERTPDPALSREIMEVLYFWLVQHIMKVDMHYKLFLESALVREGNHRSPPIR